MKLIDTIISETTIRLRLEDEALPEPNEWLDFQVPILGLKLDEHNPLGIPGRRHLATIQRAALHYVQDAISQEMQRLSALIPR